MEFLPMLLLRLLLLISSLSYAGLFIFVAFFSFLAVSEEVVLMTTGILLSQGYLQVFPGIIVAYIAILAGDVCSYYLGYAVSHSVRRLEFIKKWIHPTELRAGARWFNKYGPYSIPIARFIIGVRFQTFVFAGAVGMEFKKFFLYDALANIVFTPLVVLIGYFFGDKFVRYFQTSPLFTVIVTILFLAFLGFQVGAFKRKYERRKKRLLRKSLFKKKQNKDEKPETDGLD